MKTSSISNGSMASIYTSHQATEPLVTKWRHALRSFYTKLDQLGAAIALSEAGDLDGAKELLDKHA